MKIASNIMKAVNQPGACKHPLLRSAGDLMDPTGPVQTPAYSWGEGVHLRDAEQVPVKVEMVGVQSSCVEGQTLRASDVAQRSQEGRPLVVVSAYLRPVSATRTQADWQPTWQLCLRTFWHKYSSNGGGDFNARIGRQGAEANAPSPVPQFER
jgi:hypothetical protein